MNIFNFSFQKTTFKVIRGIVTSLKGPFSARFQTLGTKAMHSDDLWSRPEKLSNYALAPRKIGVYLIGELINRRPLNEKEKRDNFLGEGWPDNFFPHYIGISAEEKYGVRRRLSAHARKKGSKCIANLIISEVDLYFICKTGGPEHLLAEYVLQAALGGDALSCNIRLEYDRSQRKNHDLVHNFYSNLKKL